ncbi:MAG: phenylacetate-CoA oxygenase/reductase subunit PaaK [Alphaproteobacteria bacterium]|nr:phenylacetate-CoA oxygenase/reductase subunit PaaK [Alphaproteobacteria bacterium]
MAPEPAPPKPAFHPLVVAAVRPETADAVTLDLAVPPDLAPLYRFRCGQYLTLRAAIDGAEVRRSYSICSAEGEGLSVGIKRVPGGRFSTFACARIKAGDVLDVMTPQGRFGPAVDPTAARAYVAFAAGSGITPILSIARTVLAAEPRSRFTLVAGNRTVAQIMFREALEDLKNAHMARFQLLHVLSRERQDVDLLNGRIDAAKVNALCGGLLRPRAIDAAFVCGPGSMADDVAGGLCDAGVAPTAIHVERFASPEQPAAPARPRAADAPAKAGTCRVTVIRDGVRHEFAMPFGDVAAPAVIDAGTAAGLELPFSCKGGVCQTCRCLVRLGKVEMAKNFALDPWEVEAGFALSCQARPLTDELVLDYDEA